MSDATHIMDIMPTCLEIAQTTYPNAYKNNKLLPIDGISLYPLFENKKWVGHDALIWEHFGSKAIRQGDWKLVAAKSGPWELYNMKVDRSETDNLAPVMTAKVNELRQQYQQKAAKAGVLMP